jgi:hypothetical protein
MRAFIASSSSGEDSLSVAEASTMANSSTASKLDMGYIVECMRIGDAIEDVLLRTTEGAWSSKVCDIKDR